MNRGDVFQARLEPVEGSEQGGTRPVLIVSHESINTHSPVVIVVPLTSRRREHPLPTHVMIPATEGGLEADSVAKCEQVRAVSVGRLLWQRGAVSGPVMRRVDAALRRALALTPRP